MSSGVFTAEDVDGVGGNGLGDTTTVDIKKTLGDLFEHVPLVCLFH